ncbi:hypothetical protein Y11_04791 [Yersinia enterocolitica subsp. palearctica Y11]|uniref:Uncharacterized protein n=1 Tax=Yersinia enterocolitica subsp. palearctica serotype O:3 (strain DSM 13030 / CIP 106945 / Y11) TaxID=930944 RepID=A0A0H3NRM9_YERE1|nr:hypothetical protein Y11_04791 [Yersinia enterocolitica subsp. palearctica Y11]CCO67217.1 hypothetical protein D322_321 [Yersinia enterocolitica IP 10393]
MLVLDQTIFVWVFVFMNQLKKTQPIDHFLHKIKRIPL